jgi:thiopeptide-type bacteriocin biosynthesis protein
MSCNEDLIKIEQEVINNLYNNNLSWHEKIYSKNGAEALRYFMKNQWISLRIYYNGDNHNQVVKDLLKLQNIEGKYWFMRKIDGGNHIRLRVRVQEIDKRNKITNEMKEFFGSLKYLKSIAEVPYEPEVFLFGGSKMIDNIHELFCIDTLLVSRIINKEKTNLLPTISISYLYYIYGKLGLDNFEIWDVWNKLYKMRFVEESRIRNFIDKSKGTMLEVIENHKNIVFENISNEEKEQLDRICNKILELNMKGDIQNGLRAIIPYYIIFLWNRCGLSPGAQAGMSCLLTKISDPNFEV